MIRGNYLERILNTHHHVLDSAFSNARSLLEFGGGSRLIPMERAILMARPMCMYAPIDRIRDRAAIFQLITLTIGVEFVLTHFGLFSTSQKMSCGEKGARVSMPERNCIEPIQDPSPCKDWSAFEPPQRTSCSVAYCQYRQ